VVGRARNIINETWTGTVTASELAAYWRTYLADPEVLRCRRTIVDPLDADVVSTGAELSTPRRTVALQAASMHVPNEQRMNGETHGRQIYSMLVSVDGYVEDGHGRFGHGVVVLRYAASASIFPSCA
jgi:hypothetical protein